MMVIRVAIQLWKVFTKDTVPLISNLPRGFSVFIIHFAHGTFAVLPAKRT